MIPADFNPLVRARVGDDAVAKYHRVKAELTRFGNYVQEAFAAEVGGEVGGQGLPDIVTTLGAFEIRAGYNTKNAKAEEGDQALLRKWVRANGGKGYLVQALGEVVPARVRGGFPYIDGRTFFEMHGVPAARLIAIWERYAEETA